MRAYAIVAAGGSGVRLGNDMPKQFLTLGEREVILYSLRAFQDCDAIDGIFVCVQKKWKAHVETLCSAHKITKLLGVAEAGEDRRASVRAGLDALKEAAGTDNVVLVHDAARPFLSQDVILRNIEAAEKYGACNTVIPATDTPLLSQNGDTIDSMLVRKCVYQSQTPQSFQTELLLFAHKTVPLDAPDVTDDCALVLKCGHPVKLVQGYDRLIKITRPHDLLLAEALLEASRA